MKIYSVGGSVRDELLGLPVADRDYVVVGATPEDMVRLDYKPVGRDFPVFLHPQTHEEYALARTERKVARGYRGFQIYAAPDVTLEQDLARRDLTINAIARDEQGGLIDPFSGAKDLREGILRHVGSTFVEDPVRILRVARFAARFGFSVAPATMALMREMVANGEADALVPERVWQEFAKGLMEKDPARMFAILAECGLLAKLLPELGLEFSEERPANDAARMLARSLAFGASERLALPQRFAILAAGAGASDAVRALSARLKAPNDCRDLGVLAQKHARAVKAAPAAGAAALLELLEACDAFRRPGRLEDLVAVCRCCEFGARGWVDSPYPPGTALAVALAATAAVDAAAIAAEKVGAEIAAGLHRARLATIESARRRPA